MEYCIRKMSDDSCNLSWNDSELALTNQVNPPEFEVLLITWESPKVEPSIHWLRLCKYRIKCK